MPLTAEIDKHKSEPYSIFQVAPNKLKEKDLIRPLTEAINSHKVRLCESPVPEGSGGSGRGRKHCNSLGTLVTKSLAFTGRHLENESRS